MNVKLSWNAASQVISVQLHHQKHNTNQIIATRYMIKTSYFLYTWIWTWEFQTMRRESMCNDKRRLDIISLFCILNENIHVIYDVQLLWLPTFFSFVSLCLHIYKLYFDCFLLQPQFNFCNNLYTLISIYCHIQNLKFWYNKTEIRTIWNWMYLWECVIWCLTGQMHTRRKRHLLRTEQESETKNLKRRPSSFDFLYLSVRF